MSSENNKQGCCEDNDIYQNAEILQVFFNPLVCGGG
jgi:hypothetical protein